MKKLLSVILALLLVLGNAFRLHAEARRPHLGQHEKVSAAAMLHHSLYAPDILLRRGPGNVSL